LRLFESIWLQFQRFEEISTSSQLENNVMAVLILEVIFNLHDMLVAKHEV
jgi:hypothetical protein